MPNEIDYTHLYLVALRFLAHKPRTEFEVRQKLQKYLKAKNSVVPPNVIDAVIETLISEKFINDTDYVSQFISYQLASHKKSTLIIKRFLLNKGVDAKLIDSQLSLQQGSDKETVAAMAAKKLKSFESQKLTPQKTKQKLITYLLGKGFSYDDVSDAVDSILGVK